MRPPTEFELPIIEHLFATAGLDQDPRSLRVEPMTDGGMGSLLFEGASDGGRHLGRVAAECSFEDADGVPVSVTLNLDQYGLPFELDSWKVDFSMLKRWPFRHEIRDGDAT